MVDFSAFKKIALSFPESTEEPHFEKVSFRVKKKIFATWDKKKNLACLKLSEKDQHVFSLADGTFIYPVENKWGKQGWTLIDLTRVHPDLFLDALTTAYCEVAPKHLANLVRPENWKPDPV